MPPSTNPVLLVLENLDFGPRMEAWAIEGSGLSRTTLCRARSMYPKACTHAYDNKFPWETRQSPHVTMCRSFKSKYAAGGPCVDIKLGTTEGNCFVYLFPAA